MTSSKSTRFLGIPPFLSDLLLSQSLRKRLKGFKGHLLSDFQHTLSSASNTPCHCMTWLLETQPKCKNHDEICNKSFERYLKFLKAINNLQSYTKSTWTLLKMAEVYVNQLFRRVYTRIPRSPITMLLRHVSQFLP